MTEEEIRAIEQQLSCPSGTTGIEVGNKMNQSNIGMTKKTIQSLALNDKATVLELGHGNGGHLGWLLGMAKGIHYFGLEVSETMWEQAQKIDGNGQAEFKLYDGESIPYPDRYFDRIFAVNSIYFWSNPEKLMREIGRTLQPDGLLILTYADKSFMKGLPFVGEKFRLFDREDIKALVHAAQLEVVAFEEEIEEVESKIGDKVKRPYTLAKIKKLIY